MYTDTDIKQISIDTSAQQIYQLASKKHQMAVKGQLILGASNDAMLLVMRICHHQSAMSLTLQGVLSCPWIICVKKKSGH